jgi:hypothetical protein
LGTWNVRSLHRGGSLKTAVSELVKYNLDLVAVQQIKWVEGGGQPADDCTFFYGNGNANHHLGTGFFIHKRLILGVKRVEFIIGRISYVTLKGC